MQNDNAAQRKAYWQANLKLMAILLSIWFVISYLCGIVFVEQLNHFQLGGYKLGFWFAQQGAMYGFVIIVFVYAKLMVKLDRKFEMHDTEDK